MQADDSVVFNARQFLRAFFVHKVDAGRISWISVGDERNFLLRLCGSDGFGHCDNSGQGFAGVGEMVD